VKYSLLSINKDSVDFPIHFCHLVMLIAYKLKVFGDDAFSKVSSHCKVGAGVINHVLEINTVFFPLGAIRSHYPVCVCPLNEETFKAAVVHILKCTNETNLQQTYVRDGEGDVELAGLRILPIALTDGAAPGSEMLFK
jgi:hypothetical protein